MCRLNQLRIKSKVLFNAEIIPICALEIYFDHQQDQECSNGEVHVDNMLILLISLIIFVKINIANGCSLIIYP
jgi:hypothetical protein